MSDEITIAEKKYVSSKRASELSGYTQDYIGQLARNGHIDAQRVGGLWYVQMEALSGYKEKADQYKPQPPSRTPGTNSDPESLISFDGKDYISAQRAAKITRYNQDYIGQLAREGKILSRMVGNRWYVDRDALLGHKETKDALLGAVQSESVGIVRDVPKISQDVIESPMTRDANMEVPMTYISESMPLMPILEAKEHAGDSKVNNSVPERHVQESFTSVSTPIAVHRVRMKSKEANSGHNIRLLGLVGASALTIVIVISFGLFTLENGSIYAGFDAQFEEGGMMASVGNTIDSFLGILERLIVPEIVYRK